MFGLIKRETKTNLEDKYELTKSVKLVDVKGYLQKEYDRANKREDMIKQLEEEIQDLTTISLKYDAMLVVQEETQKRIEKQDKLIDELRIKIKQKDDELKLAKSKQVDIKINAENKLKEKDNEIKELKKQIKEFGKQVKETKTTRKKKGE